MLRRAWQLVLCIRSENGFDAALRPGCNTSTQPPMRRRGQRPRKINSALAVQPGYHYHSRPCLWAALRASVRRLTDSFLKMFFK